MRRIRALIREVHRRSLWQVLGIYLAASWGALQIVEYLVENFGLPAWFPAFALALLVMGLPIVLATAFVQEGIGAGEGGEDAVGTPAAASRPAEPAGAPGMPLHRSGAPVGAGLLTWRNALLGGAGAALLWGGVALGWLLFGRGAPKEASAGDARAVAEASAPDRRSIAVLPFANRSRAEDSEFFADGMHDDLLTALSKIGSLKVISRTSVMRYRDTQKPMREIASELGVATVLEGGVERAGQRVRINVQLIDARTDEHLWAETYDEELTAENLFAIRSDVAHQIAGALEAALAPEVEERLERRPTENLEAYDLYLRGRYLQSKTTKEGYEGAAALFRQAIAADPEYAVAYAGLADSYTSLFNRGHVSRDEALPEIRAAVEKALELDPNLAEAHVALGNLLFAEVEREEAERAYLRALELDPGYANGHARYGGLLTDLGRMDEALREYRMAAELDPLDRLIRANLAFTRFFTRDYAGTIAEAKKLLELEPEYGYGHYILGAAQSMLGEHEAAIAAAEKVVALEPDDLYNLSMLGYVHANAGHRDTAIAVARRVEDRGGSLKEIALIYGALGEIDTAFEYLKRAYERDPADLILLKADPSADPLRGDPRFAEFLRKAGLD